MTKGQSRLIQCGFMEMCDHINMDIRLIASCDINLMDVLLRFS